MRVPADPKKIEIRGRFNSQIKLHEPSGTTVYHPSNRNLSLGVSELAIATDPLPESGSAAYHGKYRTPHADEVPNIARCPHPEYLGSSNWYAIRDLTMEVQEQPIATQQAATDRRPRPITNRPRIIRLVDGHHQDANAEGCQVIVDDLNAMTTLTDEKEDAKTVVDPVSTYLAQVDAEVEWHNREARRARRFHFWLRTLATIGGTGMAVVGSLAAQLPPWAPAALGAAVAVAGQVIDLGQYRERWSEYRRTAERLKSELRRYRAGARPYGDAATKLDALVDRVEAILEDGLGRWAARAAKIDSSGEGR